MGVHAQRHRLVTVSQLLRNAGNISPVGNGDAGKAVAQLVGMQIGNPVPLRKLFHVPGGTLRMHGLGAAILSKYPRRETTLRLLLAQRTQKTDDCGVYIHCPVVSVLRRVHINATLRGVA